MFMTGYEDEDEFDHFVQGFDLRALIGDLKSPFLIVAGEDDISFVVFAGFSLLAFVLIMAARPPRHSGAASAARLSAGLVARAAPQRSLLRPPDNRGAVVS